jgi:hypothetical protein
VCKKTRAWKNEIESFTELLWKKSHDLFLIQHFCRFTSLFFLRSQVFRSKI